MRPPGLIILAAGGSTRMGRPKQLLPWKGHTLLRHACEAALLTSCRPVIVVLGCEAEYCQAEIADLPVITVRNERWREGMGTSVSRGVVELERQTDPSSGALFMLVDQPDVPPELIDSLVRCWQSDPALIVATEYPEGGGVPALFPRSHFPELRKLSPDRGASSLIARQSAVTLIQPVREIRDLDTPEQYNQWFATVADSPGDKQLSSDLHEAD
jgi:molybdenum cofactor cytidylyltransferase